MAAGREQVHRSGTESPLRVLDVVLASQSPRRRALLAQLGLEPAVVDPADIDETPLRRERARDAALRIARAKAETVAHRHAGRAVLAADTIVACGKRLLPKADTADQAAACLRLLSGRRHTVYGAVVLRLPDGRAPHRIVATAVVFRRLTADDIAAYLSSGEWRGKAGGYAIQGRAAAFVPRVNGSYTNVVGLPLFETVNLLRGSGLLEPAGTGAEAGAV